MEPKIEIQVEQIAHELGQLAALIHDAWGAQIDRDDVEHASQILREVTERYQNLLDQLDGEDRDQVERSVGSELRRLSDLHGRMQ